jgi:hydrogenase-4 component F
MAFLLLLGPALLAALVAFLVRPYRPAVGWTNALSSLASLGGAALLWRQAIAGSPASFGPGEFFLSTLLALAVSWVGALAAWLGPGLEEDSPYEPDQLRRYRIFSNLFWFTMLLAVTANNVGVMWVAIEATTITSAVLIPLKVNKASVEASWKYILIGSVGIALAFVGTVLAYFDFVNLVGRLDGALHWTVLRSAAGSLHPEVMRLAFVFLLIGYGTKAGLAPMHTWLPDAHSEAPAPLSAMMSGVLLAVALYAVMRWKVVVDAAVGPGFTGAILIALGVLSLVVGAFSLVVQRNYKRMLAYSSIEHVGLTSVGLALGPLGALAATLHLFNHSLAKSALFFLAGRVHDRYRTTDLAAVSGLLRVMPATGSLFALAMLAISGLPPFGLFMSEMAFFRAGFAAGRPWLMGLVLLLLLVAFISLLGHLNRMLYGEPPGAVPAGENRRPLLVLAPSLALLLLLGLAIPPPFALLLQRSAEIIAR